MKIYPKISHQEFGKEMSDRLKISEGTEIQFFDQNGITSEFDFETEVRKRKSEFPNLKEIIIHPPLDNYNIETIFLKDDTIFKNQLLKMIELTEDLNISMDFVYHTYMPVRQYISTGLDLRIKELLKIIEGKNITILIENLFMMLDEKEECEAINICKHINHPNLRCCLDTTHLHCKANIYRKDFYQMISKELNKEDCEKYIKQIHFASALKNDGFMEKKTHGRKHESFDSLKEEFEWLVKLGLKDKNFITEVGEEDYSTRKDQLQEIKWLEEIME